MGAKSVLLPLNNLHGSEACVEFTFNLDAFEGSKAELIIDTALEDAIPMEMLKLL